MESIDLLNDKTVESVKYNSEKVIIKFTDGTAAILEATSRGFMEFKIGVYEFEEIWEN